MQPNRASQSLRDSSSWFSAGRLLSQDIVVLRETRLMRLEQVCGRWLMAAG